MNTKYRWLALTAVLVLLLIAGFMLMTRDVSVTVDGQTTLIHTRALTVRQALSSMGIRLDPADQVNPPASSWLGNTTSITLVRSRLITIWLDPGETQVTIPSAAKTAREVLTNAGASPSDQDVIKLNGAPIHLDDPLPAGAILLQYSPALPLQLTSNGQTQTYHAASVSLGQALWQNGILLHGGDRLNLPFLQPLSSALELTLTPAIPLTITVDGQTIHTASAASTIGAALAENGISLQNLDYSKPSEESSLPADGKIQVIRVKLVVSDQQKVTPYTTIYSVDNTLTAGTKNVTQTGQNGISNVRVLVRYEDGVEVSSETQSEVIIQQMVNEQVTTGPNTAATYTQTSTAGSIGTIQTEAGEMAYYLTAPVHVTSYSPCRSGTGTCSDITASGVPVVQGIIAVTSAWYKIFKGHQIYIPGYGIGTVADIGGGYPGAYWIDLGYSDADYVPWSKTLTVYFLTPVPSGFTGTLP